MDIWRFFTGHTEGIQQSLMQISYTILPHLRRLSWFNLGQSFTCNPDNDSVSLVTSLWPRIIPICCRQLTSVWKNVATRNAIKGPLFSSSSMICNRPLVRLTLPTSVTRFTQISPLWQNVTSHWHFFQM